MHDPVALWSSVLAEIEKSITAANFSTWFRGTTGNRIEDGVFVVSVPSDFVREWLSEKYQKEILRSLRTMVPDIRSLDFIIAPATPTSSTKQIPVVSPKQQALPLGNAKKPDGLNPRYTFGTFIIGSFNELAHSAAQAILERPGIYNPLFIYGPTGLGKTHLIQALGNGLRDRYEGTAILYTTSEKFQVDYAQAVQNNRTASFKDRYRAYDVIIMDDIQLLAGKEKTQEELFHLFNVLYDRNKQIIFSSDKHPNYINGLEERLTSRFSQGMIIDVAKPEYESRVAILSAKAKEHGLPLSMEAIDYIASSVEGNIRELEGIVHSILVASDLRKTELSLPDIKALIRNNIKPKKNISLDDIMDVIARFYNIDVKLLSEKTRRKEIVRCRQVAMYILREDFNISFPVIGRTIGGRDHTTVMHSCDRIKEEIKTDATLVREIEQIRAMLSM
jgi:chromosomal replication initiator protein